MLLGTFQIKYIFSNVDKDGEPFSFSRREIFLCIDTYRFYQGFKILCLPYFDVRVAVDFRGVKIPSRHRIIRCSITPKNGVVHMLIYIRKCTEEEIAERRQIYARKRTTVATGIPGLHPFGGACVIGSTQFNSWNKGPAGPKGQTCYGQTRRQRKNS